MLSALMLILGLVIIQLTVSTTTASNSSIIFPPGSKPYGLSYSEHIQNFWKWLLAIPEDAAPIVDDDVTGKKCSTGQTNTNSSVFYLAPGEGGKDNRVCIVPAGKALFIPLNPVSLNSKESNGLSVQQMIISNKNEQDTVKNLKILSLAIDNTNYNYDNLSKYRQATPPFEVTLPGNATFGMRGAGTYPAVADGYYVITEPLAVGNHTIHYVSKVGGSGIAPWDHDITAKVIVK